MPLGYPLSKIILNGPEEKLKLTEYTQPAIMTIGVSIFKVLNEEFGYNLNKIKYLAGHSLGEYTALVCSWSFKFRIVQLIYYAKEEKLCRNAVPEGQGAMVAVIGMDIDDVKKRNQ